MAIAVALRHDGHTVYSYDLTSIIPRNVLKPNVSFLTHLDVLINCAGINRINWLTDVREEEWDAVVGVNAKGIYLMSQACLPMLTDSRGTIVNIVSNAAHIPMRCSLAYNASKAAAWIMTEQLARELSDRFITVFGIAPNKLCDTQMSHDIDDQVMRTRCWTREEAQAYQKQSLLVKEETPPARVADFLAYLLRTKDHHKFLTGCVLPYGA
jgi:3-oxoacyl-[acyl-carrier protein] reductase